MRCKTNEFKTFGRGQSVAFVFTPYAISPILLHKRVTVNLVPRSCSHFIILNWLYTGCIAGIERGGGMQPLQMTEKTEATERKVKLVENEYIK